MYPFSGPCRIGEIGIDRALDLLLPRVRAAGCMAAALQSRIENVQGPPQKTLGHPARDLLTHADLLIEDRIGGDVLMLFADASFHGEERDKDHVSRFIPDGRPYIITLDPVNGTLFYRDGLPLYETIATICDREWNMLGAIIYRPAFDDAFMAHGDLSSRRHVRHIRWPQGVESAASIDFILMDVPNVLHLDESWSEHLPTFRHAGYDVRDMWRDYAGQSDWAYSQADVLIGNCRAMVWRDPWAQFIDAGVFGFAVECAGGVWRRGALDRARMIYSYSIAAVDAATADLIQKLL